MTRRILLDSDSMVPLFAVLISLPTLIGGVLWLASIDANAKQALKESSKIEKIQEAVTRLEIKFGTYPKEQGE